jgi:mitochondrial translocator assembly and maintenance protein 41
MCRLVEDLTEWATLYSAGRLQKPVRVIKEGTNVEIKKALEINRRSAFQVSLLLMPPIFDQLSLFHAIASLSYVGEQFKQTIKYAACNCPIGAFLAVLSF